MSVVKSDVLVRLLGPVVQKHTGDESRASLERELQQPLEHLGVHILEHRRYNVLLKGRQMLCHLALDRIVLLPELERRS
jgi:hypothetical protein